MTDHCSAESRRAFLGAGRGLVLSGATLALLAGCDKLQKEFGQTASSAQTASQKDTELLNAALALEYEAIYAYQVGAESGLLDPAQLEMALLIKTHHERHRDVLIRTIERIEGTPVAREEDSVYLARFDPDLLLTASDVLAFAAILEKGAADTYLGVLPKFSDPLFGQFSARIAADEVMHWTALTQALGQPMPERTLTFGAS